MTPGLSSALSADGSSMSTYYTRKKQRLQIAVANWGTNVTCNAILPVPMRSEGRKVDMIAAAHARNLGIHS